MRAYPTQREYAQRLASPELTRRQGSFRLGGAMTARADFDLKALFEALDEQRR